MAKINCEVKIYLLIKDEDPLAMNNGEENTIIYLSITPFFLRLLNSYFCRSKKNEAA